jgi:hypothetical protein
MYNLGQRKSNATIVGSDLSSFKILWPSFLGEAPLSKIKGGN